MSSISETSIVTNYFEWPNDLQQATQYTFSVRTVLNCTVSGAQTLTSDWVDVIAFTSPGTPELSQVDYGTDFIQLAITDSSVYDLIRLFIDGDEYLPGTSLAFPLTLNNLVPGTSYRFDAWVYKNDLVNISETLVWCTNPETPLNLDSVTRFFYGFYVTFNAPSTGALTGYEVWSDIDSQWHGTNLSNGTYAKQYYFYNFNVTTDFARTLNLNDRNTLAAYGFDLAYGLPSDQFDNLDSGSSYTIKARAFKECLVDEHGSGEVRTIFYSEPITSTAVTGAHPVVRIATTPVSQSEIEINFQTFGQHSNDIKFNIYRYVNGATTHDGNPIENVTLSDLPKKDTNLQPASLYTYEVSVVHLGVEIYDSDRLALESEVFYGERNDTAYFPLYNTSNREDAWRGRSFNGYDATHINIYSTISGRHSIYNFYFRERTACTC
ncbi:uncharacterized protein LOC142356527 [Convolutriloba macropyga]|uniref:uncharacterized protein LOC142356527 n=1 Tax=Convolutriloba macropyga TaxID=536237 RepID=UPI003F51E1DC